MTSTSLRHITTKHNFEILNIKVFRAKNLKSLHLFTINTITARFHRFVKVYIALSINFTT